MRFTGHAIKNRCDAVKVHVGGAAMICPTPPPGGSAVACPPDGEWDNVDIALPHWTRHHTTNQYRAGVTEHSCFACKATFMGYANRSFPHFSKLAGRAASVQITRLLDARLLWNCERDRLVAEYYSTLLSVELMMAHYYLALSGQREHTTFMFRQSIYTPSEVFLPKNGGKYIAKSRGNL